MTQREIERLPAYRHRESGDVAWSYPLAEKGDWDYVTAYIPPQDGRVVVLSDPELEILMAELAGTWDPGDREDPAWLLQAKLVAAHGGGKDAAIAALKKDQAK